MTSVLEKIRDDFSQLSKLDLSTHALLLTEKNEYITIDVSLRKARRKRLNQNFGPIIAKITQIVQDHPAIMKKWQTVTDLLTLCHHFKKNISSPKQIRDIDQLKLYILKYVFINNNLFNRLNQRPIDEALNSLKARLHSEAKQEINSKNNFKTEFQKAINDIVIHPNDILTMLKQHIPEQENLSELSEKLSRKISKMILNLPKYQGKRARLKKLPSCRLEILPDGQIVRLLIIPSNPPFASGEIKSVKKIHLFDIATHLTEDHLSEDPLRKYRHEERVLISINDQIVPYFDSKEKEEEIKSDYDTQLLLSGHQNISLADLPEPLLPLASQNPKKKDLLELEQKGYPSNFHLAIIQSQVPHHFSAKQSSPITLGDKLEVLYNVAQKCFSMHEVGFVHRDVKPPNILLEWVGPEETKKLDAFLIDFHLCRKIGYSGTKRKYAFWDTCTSNGWRIPFCDTYAIAVCLGEIFIPNWFFSVRPENLTDPRKSDQTIDAITRHFIEQYLGKEETNKIFISFNTMTPRTCRQRIEIILPNYSNQKQTELRKLQKLLLLFNTALDLIIKIFHTDQQIFQHLKQNLQLQEDIKSRNLSVINQFKESFPLCNPVTFLKEIEKIITQYNQNCNDL